MLSSGSIQSADFNIDTRSDYFVPIIPIILILILPLHSVVRNFAMNFMAITPKSSCSCGGILIVFLVT